MEAESIIEVESLCPRWETRMETASRGLGIKMPIMRQRKNNGRLSRESWPGQRTKGSVSSVVAAAFPFRREYHLAMQPPICRARASSSLSLSFGSLCACWIKAVAEVQRFSRARMHGTRSIPTFIDRILSPHRSRHYSSRITVMRTQDS